MPNEDKYTMSISLNVLQHLGIGLYSNVPAVLSEIIANSWDADAKKVLINIDLQNDEIIIKDDGCGMDHADINEKFLNVGYRRRQGSPSGLTNRYNRPLMGRKGIGKLSVFSIADQIDIYSAKDGSKQAFRMLTSEIQTLIKKGGQQQYHPKEISSESIKVTSGTEIRLKKLNKRINVFEHFLRKRVARRFSILGKKFNFQVFINGKEVTVADRDYSRFVEFIWYMDDEGEKFAKSCRNARKLQKISNVIDADNNYTLKGWVATIDEQKHIGEDDNSIVVLARGKLILENLLPYVKEGGIYTKYLIGQIGADFLDIDGLDDLATTDRQRIKEDDERFIILKDYVQKNILKTIQNQWREFRREISKEKAFEFPAVQEWYDSLTGDSKKYAGTLFGKIEKFRFSDEDARKDLYRSSILAFEKIRLKDKLSVLDAMEPDASFEALLSLLGEVDEIEATEYHGIVKGRMEVINTFIGLAPKEKEKVIQRYLFEHLWLLDPSWERASTDARIEETVVKEFKKIDAKLTKEEKKGRVDIRYRTAAGKHIIIELKKYDRKVQAHELVGQIAKYRRALEKCLKQTFQIDFPNIECICILGSPPQPEDEPERAKRLLDAQNARHITYDKLIQDALRSYKDYIEKEKQISRLVEIIGRI